MAKAAGIDAGEFEVKVVELDGSYRRPRLARVFVEPVAQGSTRVGDEDHAFREAEAIAAALEGGGLGKDSLRMSFPCREAVLRVLNVPFVGEDQIRKVIKFEAEGSIHSHNVDDMVVDFHVLAEDDAETRVLIAAVPKPPMRTVLSALERSGVEPVTVDLDTMALLRCAEWCGVFDDDGGDEEADGSDLPALGAPSRVVLDLGARSTRVLVVVNGALIDMRALRIGSDSIVEDVSQKIEVDAHEARDAVWKSLTSGDDGWVEIVDPEADEDDGEGAALSVAADGERTLVVHDDVAAARDRYLGRLRLELNRFLASVGSSNAVEAVWMTGGASEIPGVGELLEEVFGVEMQPLDVLGNLNHKLTPEEEADLGPRLAVAVGLALQGLGGNGGFNLRREDLAFTKGFDRIKFPLAVACMLALFLALVYAVGLYKELGGLKQQYGAIYTQTEKQGRRGATRTEVKFYGYLGNLVNPGMWFGNSKTYDEREYDKLIQRLVDTPVFDRLGRVENALKSHFRELQQESGYYPDLRMGSGLGALCELSELLLELEPRLGRYLVTDLEVRLPYSERNRFVKFNIVLRSDEQSGFRQKGEQVLVEALQQRCGLPTSAFASLEETTERKVYPEDSDGRGSYELQVRINLKPEDQYPVFPTSTS